MIAFPLLAPMKLKVKAMSERDAIVARLRTKPLWTPLDGFFGPKEIADAIERGEHKKEKTDEG
jgi:hypothetical protein